MSAPRKPAFFAQPLMTWGPYGKPITVGDFKNCLGTLQNHFGNDPKAAVESAAKFFQFIKEGKCPGDAAKVPHVTYRFARPLIEKPLAVHGRKELRGFWNRYEALATAFALEGLDIGKEQPLDGFIPHDFFILGAHHNFKIEDSDLEDILSTAVRQMLRIFPKTANENVLLHFPGERTPFFENPKSDMKKGIQTDRQNKLKTLILKRLQETFKDYVVTFEIAGETELQGSGPFVEIQFVNAPQPDSEKLGDTVSKDAEEGGYRNNDHDEDSHVYVHTIFSNLESKGVIMTSKEPEKEANLKLDRWARLIAYVATHELLHAFGMPHFNNDESRTPLLMDREIAFDLLPYWKGAMEIAKIRDAELLRKLLTPKQKTCLDFILKKAFRNQTGNLNLRREKGAMGCEFREINDRCYIRASVLGLKDQYFDLFTDEQGQEVNGFGFVGPDDLYLPPDAEQTVPVRPEIPFREDPQGRMLSLGHFFGRPITSLHPDYHRSYFTPPLWGDLTAIGAMFLPRIEIAILSNDLSTILVDKEIPHWQEPITDEEPKLGPILERLKKIALGEAKPPRVYKEEAEQRKYEAQNSKRALEMIDFYSRLGSVEAGKILEDLKSAPKMPAKPPAGQAAEAKPSGACHAGAMFSGALLMDNYREAERCAQLLTQSTGRSHGVETDTENIGDGFPAFVSQTYYRVVEK